MGLYAAPRLLPAGDGAVSVELGDEISREANARALTLERLLLDARLPGLGDTVPSFRALLVQYDPLVLPWATLHARLLELASRLADAVRPRGAGWSFRAPTAGSTGPTSTRSRGASPSPRRRSSSSTRGPSTTCTSSGFTPGLPYMAGQPERLTIPRLDRPRVKTPAGSVGIGGTQSSIYSVESPGGFWLLGRTPLRLYDPAAAEPILLRAGDRVRFRPIEPAEFEAIAEAVASGAYRPRIEVDP